MNLFPLKGPSTRKLLLSLCLLVAATIGWAQTNVTPPARTNLPAPERFLFIFDISAGMEKRATNMSRVAGQLISSGLNGQLERGDTIGFWTFNNELHTGEFPLQVWTPQARGELALALGQFLRQQRYARSPRLAPVMAQLTNVVADSDKITVILLSDGSEALTGTPFDVQIAEAFKLNSDEQRRLAMPFVTILRAAQGKFVSLRVNTPPWPIELPAFPGETNPVEPPPAEPPPQIASAPTNLPVAPPPLPKPERPPVATNVAPTPATNVTVAVEPTPPPIEAPSNPPPVVTVPPEPVVSNAVSNVVAQSVEPMEPTNTLVATPAEAKIVVRLPLLPALIGGGIVLFGLVIMCTVLIKRSRETTRVSLITRSMNKDKK